MSDSKDPLFIVDNSDGTQNGIDYLREWCQIASSFDIATGYFDVGALTALDGEWQKLKGMRILMGDEVTPRTGKALREAIKIRVADALDKDLEALREPNPFLNGVPAVVEAIRQNQIQCKVYSKDKFHAKTYITHGKSSIVGSRALVGSSNFTKAGLSQNVELNIMLESGSEVAQLQRRQRLVQDASTCRLHHQMACRPRCDAHQWCVRECRGNSQPLRHFRGRDPTSCVRKTH